MTATAQTLKIHNKNKHQKGKSQARHVDAITHHNHLINKLSFERCVCISVNVDWMDGWMNMWKQDQTLIMIHLSSDTCDSQPVMLRTSLSMSVGVRCFIRQKHKTGALSEQLTYKQQFINR